MFAPYLMAFPMIILQKNLGTVKSGIISSTHNNTVLCIIIVLPKGIFTQRF